jgi:hypothetical protein
MNEYEAGAFGFDLQFLMQTDTPIVLSRADGREQLVVSAKYQGKVFTSTAEGMSGPSLGYINHRVFDPLAEPNPHILAYGGENRLWIGPEGGRFSIFFEPGVEQVYDNWFTPAPIDSEPWSIVRSAASSVDLTKTMEVVNYLGARFSLRLDRSVALLDAEGIRRALGITPSPSLRTVAYLTDNSITNLNDFEWTPATGTICIWMLDMFKVGPRSLTIVPFARGAEEEMGNVATTDYFGPIPHDRYAEGDSLVFLKTDGRYRSKIGLSPRRAKGIAANYDPDAGHLVVATFDMDKNAAYLNQEWSVSKEPMVGDVLNAYNDGPLDDGSLMGPFLELESDSPAALLKPGQQLSHRHCVYHFCGSDAALSEISQSLFGISITQLKEIFNP